MALEGHDLKFGWHGYVWYEKIKVNVDFKSRYIRHTILRIWNKYKSRLCQKTPLWVSTQKAFFR